MAEHHIIPFGTYIKVFLALVFLTILTVITAKGMNLSPFNGLVAFSIATVKAGLVMAFFMHLKYDAKMNSIIILSSFGFVLLLFALSIFDIYTRVPVESSF